MLDSEPNRQEVLKYFPNLQNDANWKITSPQDPRYNCIAWACLKNDRHYWPTANLDGVEWPFNLPYDTALETFIELFRNLEYEICDNIGYEEGYQKITI